MKIKILSSVWLLYSTEIILISKEFYSVSKSRLTWLNVLHLPIPHLPQSGSVWLVKIVTSAEGEKVMRGKFKVIFKTRMEDIPVG